MHYLNILHQSSLNCWQLQYKVGEVLNSNLSIKDKNQNSLLISPFVGHGNDNDRKTRLERFFSYIYKKKRNSNKFSSKGNEMVTYLFTREIYGLLTLRFSKFFFYRACSGGGNEHKGNPLPRRTVHGHARWKMPTKTHFLSYWMMTKFVTSSTLDSYYVLPFTCDVLRGWNWGWIVFKLALGSWFNI